MFSRVSHRFRAFNFPQSMQRFSRRAFSSVPHGVSWPGPNPLVDIAIGTGLGMIGGLAYKLADIDSRAERIRSFAAEEAFLKERALQHKLINNFVDIMKSVELEDMEWRLHAGIAKMKELIPAILSSDAQAQAIKELDELDAWVTEEEKRRVAAEAEAAAAAAAAAAAEASSEAGSDVSAAPAFVSSESLQSSSASARQ